MEVGSKLRGGGGFCLSFLGSAPLNLNTFEKKIDIEFFFLKDLDPSLNWLTSESCSQKSLQCFACMGSHTFCLLTFCRLDIMSAYRLNAVVLG